MGIGIRRRPIINPLASPSCRCTHDNNENNNNKGQHLACLSVSGNDGGGPTLSIRCAPGPPRTRDAMDDDDDDDDDAAPSSASSSVELVSLLSASGETSSLERRGAKGGPPS
jgi:hypothetical protein